MYFQKESKLSNVMAKLSLNEAMPIKSMPRHQKCKSLSANDEFKDKLTEDDPYKNAKPAALKGKSNTSGSQNNQGHKFTCRYEIQIDNDKDFQVARKLIGAKGGNMKQIIENCKEIGENLEKEGYGKIKIQDLVKLRLRGKGSGFKEGPKHEESNDPLHLCVSSKYFQVYEKACAFTEDLVNSIYDQYLKYQLFKNPDAKRLRLKKYENTYTRKNSSSSNNSGK